MVALIAHSGTRYLARRQTMVHAHSAGLAPLPPIISGDLPTACLSLLASEAWRSKRVRGTSIRNSAAFGKAGLHGRTGALNILLSVAYLRRRLDHRYHSITHCTAAANTHPARG